jgi:hypothetical protein
MKKEAQDSNNKGQGWPTVWMHADDRHAVHVRLGDVLDNHGDAVLPDAESLERISAEALRK